MHSSIRIPAILQDSVIKYTRLQSGRVPFSTFISYKSQEKLQVTILIKKYIDYNELCRRMWVLRVRSRFLYGHRGRIDACVLAVLACSASRCLHTYECRRSSFLSIYFRLNISGKQTQTWYVCFFFVNRFNEQLHFRARMVCQCLPFTAGVLALVENVGCVENIPISPEKTFGCTNSQ